MKFALLSLVFLQVVAQAEPVLTRVKEIVLDESSKDALVFSTSNGRVYHIPQDSELLTALQIAEQTQNPVELTLQANRVISDVKILPPTSTQPLSASDEEYVPTVIESRDTLYKYFNELTPTSRFYTRSQCYRRAHTWSYDLFKMHDVKSMKAVLFFTKKYIREARYDWWFHVAPYVMYKSNGQLNEAVMDKEYAPDGVVPLDGWASAFIKDGSKCPEIKKYSDYEDHQEESLCYVRKVPMYYYNPAEIEELDKEGKVRTSFDPADIYDMGSEMYRRKY